MAITWWLIIALILAVIEVATVDLFFIMLAVAAVCAGVGSWAGLGLYPQLGIFTVAAAILVLGVRPWARRVLHASTPKHATNVDALIGQRAEVTQVVDDRAGRVRLAGEIWSARSADTSTFAVGTVVRVTGIDGATAVVAGVESSSAQLPHSSHF